jgi:hypothetical protein
MPLSFTVSDSLILYKSIIRVSFAFSNRLFHLSLLTRIAFDSENVVFDSDIEDIKGMITYDIFVLINLIFINQILGIPDMVNFVTERLDGISQAPHVRSKALISFFVPGCDFLARPRLDILFWSRPRAQSLMWSLVSQRMLTPLHMLETTSS